MKHHLIVLLALFVVVSFCPSRVPHMLLPPGFASADTIPVPQGLVDEITKALAEAVSGDIVLASNRSIGDPTVAYKPFTMKSGVQVLAAPNQTPIIDGADSVSITADWPATATSSTILRGFTIRGGTGQVAYVRDAGKIQNCVVENGGADYATYGIRSTGNTEISGCTVTMTGDQSNYAIHQSDGVANISNCDISVNSGTNRSSIGIWTDSDPTGHIDACDITLARGTGINAHPGDVRIQGCTIDITQYDQYYNWGISCSPTLAGSDSVVVSDCLITTKDAVGISIEVEKVEVKNCTIHRVDTGIWGTGGNEKVHHCIVSQSNYAGYQGCAFDDVNAEYCIAYPSSEQSCGYESGSQGTGSIREDPRFCNATGGKFTLRVDSYGNPQNAENPDDTLIGAFPVACMYGTLARSSTFGGGSLDVLGDTTIPVDSTLTLNADAVLVVDDVDNQSSGGDVNEVQLSVRGDLITNGTSGHEVIFRSVTGTAGAWDGIIVPSQASNAEISLDYTTIQDAEAGIIADYAWHVVDLNHVTVDHCQSKGITLFTIAAGTHSVSGVNVTVDMDNAPTGIYLAGYQNTTMDDLVITGNSNGTYGLHIEALPYSGNNPLFTDTYVSGLDQGTGIFVDQLSPEFQYLNVSDCKWGVYLQGTDVPKVQPHLYHTPSQNYIANCETGLYVNGDPAPDVDDLLIFACHTGLYTDSTSTGSYTDVTIDADSTTGSVGFKAWSTAAHTFRHGNILNFDNEGVNVNPAGLVNLGTSSDPGNNQIYSDSTLTPTAYVKCRNRVAELGDVKAEKNWWGVNPPPSNMFSAGVDYFPWLTQVPSSTAPGMEMVALPVGLLAIGPNPMQSQTTISFSIPLGAKSVSLKIYDLNGRLVRDLLPKGVGPGSHQVAWDGRDTAGHRAPTGVYFVRYRDTATDQSRKVVRLP